MDRLEGMLNYCFPKSLILYAEKRSPAERPEGEAGARPAAHLLRRLPRQHALRRTGGLPLVPRARAGEARASRWTCWWARPTRTRCPSRGSVTQLPNQQFWGQAGSPGTAPAMLPRPESPAGSSTPLNFYELAASRLGFLPEPFAFSVRALSARSRPASVAGDPLGRRPRRAVSRLGLLGVHRALGLPVVTTIHHPLTVDRRASFVRDETLARRDRHHDLLPRRHAARSWRGGWTAALHLLRERAPPRSCDDFGVRRRAHPHGGTTGSTPSSSAPDPERRSRTRRTRSCAWVAQSDPEQGHLTTLIEACPCCPGTTSASRWWTTTHPDNVARKRAATLGCCRARDDIVGRVADWRPAGGALPPGRTDGGAVALRGLRAPRRRSHGLRHTGGRHARRVRFPRSWRPEAAACSAPRDDAGGALHAAVRALLGGSRSSAPGAGRGAGGAGIEAAYAWPT